MISSTFPTFSGFVASYHIILNYMMYLLLCKMISKFSDSIISQFLLLYYSFFCYFVTVFAIISHFLNLSFKFKVKQSKYLLAVQSIHII